MSTESEKEIQHRAISNHRVPISHELMCQILCYLQAVKNDWNRPATDIDELIDGIHIALNRIDIPEEEEEI